MRFWKLSSLPDLDDMAPTPLEKRPPRPGELLLAAGAAFFAAGLGATFLTTFLTAFGAALLLGAATAFGVDFLPPPNMAGSAERTAVRVPTAEAGATKASVLWRQKIRPGERRRARVIPRRYACGAQTDARTGASPPPRPVH